MLRGTNTGERISAACAVLRRLAGMRVHCIAATHDGELPTLLGVDYDNYHFAETFENGDMRFDYRLKPAPARASTPLPSSSAWAATKPWWAKPARSGSITGKPESGRLCHDGKCRMKAREWVKGIADGRAAPRKRQPNNNETGKMMMKEANTAHHFYRGASFCGSSRCRIWRRCFGSFKMKKSTGFCRGIP